MSQHHKLVNWRRLARLRRQVLAEQPICAYCNNALSEEMDHIIPVHKRPDLILDRDNTCGTCRNCHKEKTRKDMQHHGKPEVSVDGWNVD